MPLEFVTDSFLPSKKAQGVTDAQHTGEKTLSPGLKTGGQLPGQDSAVIRQIVLPVHVWKGRFI
jgi:hypothetical protein